MSEGQQQGGILGLIWKDARALADQCPYGQGTSKGCEENPLLGVEMAPHFDTLLLHDLLAHLGPLDYLSKHRNNLKNPQAHHKTTLS